MAGFSPRSRRQFVTLGSITASSIGLGAWLAQWLRVLAADLPEPEPPPRFLKPPALKPGDTLAIVSPAGPVTADELASGLAFLRDRGFRVQLGAHALDRDGYLAGRDRDRAADLNAAFADDRIAGIICTRGGWGCGRLLPLLNYDLIRSHPKILLGYSDTTALLLAIYAKTGLIGFHGPVVTSVWNPFSVAAWQAALLNGQAVQLANPAGQAHRTIIPGKAQGPLLGGNLSVVTALLGSDYLPAWDGAILFLEEVDEEIYRIDRLFVQLKLAGVLDRLAGFVFGQCRDCGQNRDRSPTLTLDRLFSDWIAPLKIPALAGAPIGHVPDKWTLPVGLPVELDATGGTIRFLEPAVAIGKP